MMDFQTFARINGVEIGSLIVSDKIIRTGTVLKPKSKNGSYLFDGERGWVQAWDADGEIHFYGGEQKEFSAADKKAWAAKKQAQELELQQRNKKAADKAKELMSNAEIKEHGYLSYKGLNDAKGYVTSDDQLLIPMNSLVGKLQGIQAIKWIAEDRKYEKKMIYGTKAKGAVYRIGSKSTPETFLCEGYATGLSIKKAVERLKINASVLVCFSANNLVDISQSFKQKTYVFADNDESRTGETCALKTGLPFCMSDELGDANDLHQSKGLMAVCKKIMEVRAT